MMRLRTSRIEFTSLNVAGEGQDVVMKKSITTENVDDEAHLLKEHLSVTEGVGRLTPKILDDVTEVDRQIRETETARRQRARVSAIEEAGHRLLLHHHHHQLALIAAAARAIVPAAASEIWIDERGKANTPSNRSFSS